MKATQGPVQGELSGVEYDGEVRLVRVAKGG